MRARPFLISALLIAACKSDSTAPKTDISGHWSYSASNVAGSGISCNISGVSATITETGSTFTGSTSGGTITCSGPGGTASQAIGNDVIANGTINGASVQFDIGTSDIHNAGTLSGNSISGTVTIKVNSGGSTYTLTGNFSAVKQ